VHACGASHFVVAKRSHLTSQLPSDPDVRIRTSLPQAATRAKLQRLLEGAGQSSVERHQFT
jgi:hypothetical protein